MTENEISKVIVDAAFEVYRVLGGPGLLEDIYEEALAAELGIRGMEVQRQIEIPVVYKGKTLAKRLRIDMIVGGFVLVENKSIT